MSDVRFYDFNFNLIHILPSTSNLNGYSSVNVTQEFNNSGSFDLVFSDDELKRKIEEHKCNLFVVWKGFQGFLTSYTWKDDSCRALGMHLNGLLHRAVIPSLYQVVTVKDDEGKETQEKQAITDTLDNHITTALSNISWLEYASDSNYADKVSYLVEKYSTADTYIQGLMDLVKGGYAITADFKNKKLYLTPHKTEQNPIMLSENNLNAYNFESSYINKNLAYGAWFEKEVKDRDGNTLDPVWTYVTTDGNQEGIFRIDTVLTSKTEAEAMEELKKKIPELTITADTRNIQYGIDYKIGDVVRIQKDGKTVKKLVSGINLWSENEYGEQPIFTEWEELTNE